MRLTIIAVTAMDKTYQGSSRALQQIRSSDDAGSIRTSIPTSAVTKMRVNESRCESMPLGNFRYVNKDISNYDLE